MTEDIGDVQGVSFDRHVSQQEAEDAADTGVGDGAPGGALQLEVEEGLFMVKTLKPTRKWVAGLVTGLASVAASWIVTGAFDDVERGMLGTLLVALAGAYFRENEPTPGGVPEVTTRG